MKEQKSMSLKRAMSFRSHGGNEGTNLAHNEFSYLVGEDDDPLAELLQGAEVVEYKRLSQRMKKDCVPTVRKFIKSYISGNFTGGALGDVRALDQDMIVRFLVDMLHYDNELLTVEAMNMLQRHFNQFLTVVETM